MTRVKYSVVIINVHVPRGAPRICLIAGQSNAIHLSIEKSTPEFWTLHTVSLLIDSRDSPEPLKNGGEVRFR